MSRKRFAEKFERGKLRVKEFLHVPSRNPSPAPSSTSANNNPAPNNISPALSSVPTGTSTHVAAISESHSAIVSPNPVSASVLSAGAPDTHPVIVKQENMPAHTVTLTPPVPTSGEGSAGKTAWAGLKTFLGLLNQSADAFGPLKSAVGGILGCIEIYERVGQGREGYERLRNELEFLFDDLSKDFREPTSPVIISILNDLAKNIENELATVKSKAQRNMVERVAEANEDANDILECYRRIQRHLQRLALIVNVNILDIVEKQATEGRLDKLVPSLSARYDHAATALLRGACTSNTRFEVLKMLVNWSYDESSEKIYWLNGMAGTGKTTIAYSFCEQLQSASKLAASFFCSRQLPECRNPNLIFPTIAYQLARFSPPFRLALSQVIERDPDARTRLLPDQLRLLILEPLNEVKDRLRKDLVVVIDALDECEGTESVSQILQTLLTYAPDLPIRFFLTSRPEPHIHKRMTARQGDRTRFELHLHNLDRSIVKEDIKIYLNDKLGKRSVASEDLERLAERSGVLFIYAATVVRYLSAKDFSMCNDRLRLVLSASVSSPNHTRKNVSPSSSDEDLEWSNRSEEEIDQLYTTILETAIEDSTLEKQEKSRIKAVLNTVVCAQEPLSTSDIATLLKIGASSLVHQALQPLLSVLNVSEGFGLVTTLHESFPNYMLDQNRAPRFHCSLHKHNARMAKECFRLIKIPKPSFNICNLESSFLFDDEVEDIQERVEKSISRELLYACRYWGAHLALAEPSESLTNILSEFLEARFLLWMEVLNLKRCISSGAGVLPKVQKWCQIARCPDHVQQLLSDGWSFITSYSANPTSRSTPHIYVSALPFWPEERAISKNYLGQMQGLITPSGTAMRARKSAPLAICESGGSVCAVAYSPDGTRIVSGSDDRTVRIWDAHTGQAIGEPLQGHTSSVRSVGYSPDGARIVSGSSDDTVRIWDAHTGQAIGEPLQGHTDTVWSVGYSPDGSHIVFGCDDETARICKTDIQLQNSENQPERLHSTWTMGEDGWVLDSRSRRLIWIPAELRDVVLCPPRVAIISRRGSFGLNFSQARIGDLWRNCYRPVTSSESK